MTDHLGQSRVGQYYRDLIVILSLLLKIRTKVEIIGHKQDDIAY